MRGICSREIYHHVYIYTWGHIYLCIYTYIHVSCAVFAAGRYVHIYIYTHVDTSIYIYTHTCRHIYLYIYTNTRFMRSFAAGRYVPVYIIYIYIYIPIHLGTYLSIIYIQFHARNLQQGDMSLCIYIGLARTVHIHRKRPCIWWFPCQKHRICTVYRYMLLANPVYIFTVYIQYLHTVFSAGESLNIR
jgi:hypothetical protein